MPAYHLRSHAIYNYIRQCRDEDQLPPTMREISEACQIPLTAIFRHLDWLQARGYVSRDTTTRSIRLGRPFLTDEEQVYACIMRTVKATSLAPSLHSLRKSCALSRSRVTAALHALEQSGRLRPDPENPRFFYPADFEL